MQREIRFRGKRTDNGEWIYGAFVPDATERSHGSMVTWGFIRWYNREIGKMETVEVGRETVGQYTGINDSKRTKEYPDGQPIYEGDILQINIMDWNRAGNIIASGKAAVGYRGCTFGVEWGFSLEFTSLDSFSHNCTFEVIGNAWDNPELLEVEHERR